MLAQRSKGLHGAARLQACAVKPAVASKGFHNGHLRHSTGFLVHGPSSPGITVANVLFGSLHSRSQARAIRKIASRWSKCRALNGIGKRRFESPILRSAVTGYSPAILLPSSYQLGARLTSKCQDVKPFIFIRRVSTLKKKKRKKPKICCLRTTYILFLPQTAATATASRAGTMPTWLASWAVESLFLSPEHEHGW